MKNFEIIDTTADIGIRAFGTDWSSLYANAAMGMLNLITNIEKIEGRLTREISITAPDRETLLAGWLNELIYLFDAEMLLFCRFEIVKISKSQLKARCYGEKADLSRHEIKRGIKSATYHKLKVEKMKDGSFKAEVIFDI